MKVQKIYILIVSTAISIFGFLNLFDIFPMIKDWIDSLPITVQIIIKIVVFILSFLYFVMIVIKEIREKDVCTLNTGKKSYHRYFNKWYAKDGEISIYCSNMEWIKDDRLLSTLIMKSKQGKLRMYIEQIGHISEQLQTAGAKLYIIKNVNINVMSFSIRDVNSSKSCIIRYNTEDDHRGHGIGINIKVHEIYGGTQQKIINKLSELIEKVSEKV